MNDDRLKKIESHIGHYKSESIKREESPRFETFNPNGEIQELVNEVRRLKTQITIVKKDWQENMEQIIYCMGLVEAQNNIAEKLKAERDKAIEELRTTEYLLSDAAVDNQSISQDRNSKKIIIKDLEERVENLEKEKTELLRLAALNNTLRVQFNKPETEKELEIAQTARATAETERDELQAELAEAVAIIYSCGMIPCGLWKDSECCKPGKLRCFETCDKCIRTEIKHRM